MSCGNCKTCKCIKSDEQQAIRQHLSKPAPSYDACGCMGQQPLRGEENKPWGEAKLYPLCPCGMQMIEEVDGQFYEIKERRSPDGITHEAVLFGPVGGPYLFDPYGRPIK